MPLTCLLVNPATMNILSKLPFKTIGELCSCSYGQVLCMIINIKQNCGHNGTNINCEIKGIKEAMILFARKYAKNKICANKNKNGNGHENKIENRKNTNIDVNGMEKMIVKVFQDNHRNHYQLQKYLYELINQRIITPTSSPRYVYELLTKCVNSETYQ